MISFTLPQTNAKIKRIKPKQEQKGKMEKELAYDIDISVEIDANVLSQLAVGENIDYESFFYDEKGATKAIGLKRLEFNREYEDHRVRIDFDLAINEEWIVFKPKKITKFYATPIFNRRMKLSFQCQHNPTDEQLLFLNHGLTKDNVKLTIEAPDQGDLFSSEESAED